MALGLTLFGAGGVQTRSANSVGEKKPGIILIRVRKELVTLFQPPARSFRGSEGDTSYRTRTPESEILYGPSDPHR